MEVNSLFRSVWFKFFALAGGVGTLVSFWGIISADRYFPQVSFSPVICEGERDLSAEIQDFVSEIYSVIGGAEGSGGLLFLDFHPIFYCDGDNESSPKGDILFDASHDTTSITIIDDGKMVEFQGIPHQEYAPQMSIFLRRWDISQASLAKYDCCSTEFSGGRFLGIFEASPVLDAGLLSVTLKPAPYSDSLAARRECTEALYGARDAIVKAISFIQNCVV